MPARAHMPVLHTAAILAGGALGALARGGLAEAWPADGSWPWGTFAANLAGTVVLAGLVAGLRVDPIAAELWRRLIGTGFAGALTTFSAFQIEAAELANEGRIALAAAYVATSLALGVALATATAVLARRGRRG